MVNFFKLNGRIEVIQGTTTLNTSSDGTNFVGNGFNVVGGATVARFSLTAQMDIRNIVEDPNDGSVSFDYYGLNYIRFLQEGSSKTGYQQHIRLYASLGNNNTPTLVFDDTKDLGDTFDTGNIMATSTIAPVHYHIEAGQQTPFSDLYIARLLNEALLSNDEWKFYVTGVTNTQPPLYTPMAIRKGSVWKSLNKGGVILIRKSGSWQTVAKQFISNSGKPNIGTSRIRKNNVWVQQGKIGD